MPSAPVLSWMENKVRLCTEYTATDVHREMKYKP